MPQFPIINIAEGKEFSINSGEELTLDASATTALNGIYAYLWEENGNALGTEEKLTLDNLPLGEHNITLTVTDNDGFESVDSVLVTVKEAVATTSTIKKTGQTKSYDENGDEVTDGSVKDDGHYQKGVTPSYSRELNGTDTVTDNITKLIWQDNAEAKTIKKQWLTDDNYNDCRDNGNNCENTSGDTAKTYCSNLTLGGYDWRLPSSKELESIQDYSRYSPSINPIFENTSSNYYWSSTSGKNGSSNAWIVHFYNGNVDYNFKYNTYYVRCVRAGE